MICNISDVEYTTCQQNGDMSPPLPITDCSKLMKGIVEVVSDEICPFTMYRVGYKLSNELFLELYRSCYDVPNQTAHFVIHQAYPITSPAPRPDQSFTTDGVITGAMAATFQASSIFETFKTLLGSNQNYIASPSDIVFNRGHLVPSADFGFDSQMRLTFKYLNVVAQFGSINRGNWKTLETWIRNQLNNGNFEVLNICTGGFGVLQLPHSITGELISIYLNPPSGNAVPEWLFKTVCDGNNNSYAFLTYNNIFNLTKPTPNCQQVACPATLQFVDTKEAGFSFCCDLNDFLTKNVPHLANVCSVI
ncbi:GH16223 [Drosophila grimshawi]|uniref:GH16223 n=2 Tax=Drosophila grimshawi TaxID=7222 RepID=B4JUA4_DROGR|nr:GH16223 [Drosophila grimshawi]